MPHLAGKALHDQPLHIIRNRISALFGKRVGLNAGDKLCSPLLGPQPSLYFKHSHHRGRFIGQQAVRKSFTWWLSPPLMFAHASLGFLPHKNLNNNYIFFHPDQKKKKRSKTKPDIKRKRCSLRSRYNETPEFDSLSNLLTVLLKKETFRPQQIGPDRLSKQW